MRAKGIGFFVLFGRGGLVGVRRTRKNNDRVLGT